MALQVPHEKLAELRFRRGKGCIHCRQTGYFGRSGVFEVMPVSPKIRKLVISKAEAPEIVRAARDEGMRSLRESAIEKLVRGVSTVPEILRVTTR
jgi:general secretion pathway protein E